MDFKAHIVQAWNLTLKYIVSLILMTLVMSILGVLTMGILAPVMMAGYMNALLLMMRHEREPKIQDLFSEMRLFVPLFLFTIVAFFAILIGFMFFFVPGILIIFALTFSCLYMLPLMVDRQLSLTDAVKESHAMALRGNVADHLVVAILFLGISGIGGSFVLAFLFTQPFATLFLLSAYEEKTKLPEKTTPPAPPPPTRPE